MVFNQDTDTSARMIAVATVLLMLVPLALSAGDEPVVPIPESALKAIDAGQWDQAEKSLGPALKAGNPDAEFCAGVIKFHKGNTHDAAPYFERALKARPYDSAAAKMLGQCVANCGGNYKSRLPQWADSLEELRPYDADAVHAVGRAWINKYFWKIEEGGVIYGKNPDVELRKATDRFRLAGKLQTARRDNDHWLAFLYYRSGRYEDALKHAERYTASGPAGYDTYIIIGGCLTNLRRHEEADLAFAQARRLAPGKVGVVEYERGKALFAAGKYNEAVRAFRLVLQNNKAQFNVRHRLALAAFCGRDVRLGLWGFVESRNVDDRTDSIYFIGRCAYAVGRYDLAEQHIQAAIDKLMAKYKSWGSDQREPTEWTHYLGRAQWGQGKYDEALKNLQSAFERRPGRPLYARWLLEAWLAYNNLHKAIVVCQRFGNAGHTDDAIETIRAILTKWAEAAHRRHARQARQAAHIRGVRRPGGPLRKQGLLPHRREILRTGKAHKRTDGSGQCLLDPASSRTNRRRPLRL